MEIFAFPWVQIGNMLRLLSLSGVIGNGAACVFYVIIGSAPLALWGYIRKKKRSSRWDWLLPLLSAALFLCLWFLVNPSYIGVKLFPVDLGGVGSTILAGVIDSILFSWILLHFFWDCEKIGRKALLRSLEILLGLWCVLAAGTAVWQEGAVLLERFAALKDNATALDRVFLSLRAAISLLPQVLELILTGMLVGFLHSWEEEDFGESALGWLARLKTCSRVFLVIILLANTAFNLLQLLVARLLTTTDFTVLIPLRKIIAVLGIFLLSRFFLLGKKAQDDNNLFI